MHSYLDQGDSQPQYGLASLGLAADSANYNRDVVDPCPEQEEKIL